MSEHLTADELDLWAQGLLPAVRAMHLTECSLCRAEAQAERALALTLAQLPQLAPAAGFADRVMRHVRIPTRSGDFQA
jgi:predicted anti-sigma-YlaC factor YlaD